MRSRIAHLDRARRIVQVLVRHGLLGLVDQLGLSDRRLSGAHGRGEVVAARFGRRLSLALNDLGPTFVKLGQFLSTREDLFPAPVVRELAELQDNAGTLPAAAIRQSIAVALGRPVADAYAAFDEAPLAAGSIAQVHRARTFDGREVVVKVRRPAIERTIEADLALLRVLAEQAARRSADIARFDPVGLIEELGANLRLELDLAREAACLRRMRAELGGTAHVPAVVDPLCTTAVLTMEWIDGKKLSAIEAGQAEAARAVIACFATQYLRAGTFHADPHAGNLLYTSEGRLAVIDLGANGEIDAAMRRTLLDVASAASARDGERLADVGLAMVHAPADLDRAGYRRDLGRLLDDALSRPLGEVRISVLMQEFFTVARRHRLRFRSEYFLLFRSAMLVDGVLRRLDPSIDPIVATRRHLMRNALSPRWFPTVARLAGRGIAARLARVPRPRLPQPRRPILARLRLPALAALRPRRRWYAALLAAAAATALVAVGLTCSGGADPRPQPAQAEERRLLDPAGAALVPSVSADAND